MMLSAMKMTTMKISSNRKFAVDNRMPGGSSGFTLVELLVALTLATIISMTIMIISNTAREIYNQTTKKVELSNRFRLALMSLDRDFSQMIDTANMEFFADGKGSGSRKNLQWDEGEELPDKKDELGKGVLDGGIYGSYDEFASISEYHYHGLEAGKDPDVASNWKIHDAYQAYFRTMTYIDGKVREANVEYMLLDPNRPDAFGNPQVPTEVIGEKNADLVLLKIVRYHNIEPSQLLKVNENFPIVRKRVEVCSNITDFRIEYSVENPFNNKVRGGYRTPDADYKKPSELVTRPRPLPTRDPKRGRPPFKNYRKVFGYGSNNIKERYPRATAFRANQGEDPTNLRGTEHTPVLFGFSNSSENQFAELVQGSTIYIFTESNRGQVAGAPAPTLRKVQIASKHYTVKGNIAGRLQLYEDLDSTTWTSDQNSVLYKAAYLPASIMVTLRIVDDKGLDPKTLQREIWVRRKSR